MSKAKTRHQLRGGGGGWSRKNWQNHATPTDHAQTYVDVLGQFFPHCRGSSKLCRAPLLRQVSKPYVCYMVPGRYPCNHICSPPPLVARLFEPGVLSAWDIPSEPLLPKFRIITNKSKVGLEKADRFIWLAWTREPSWMMTSCYLYLTWLEAHYQAQCLVDIWYIPRYIYMCVSLTGSRIPTPHQRFSWTLAESRSYTKRIK